MTQPTVKKFTITWHRQELEISTDIHGLSFTEGNIDHAKHAIQGFNSISDIEYFLFKNVTVNVKVINTKSSLKIKPNRSLKNHMIFIGDDDWGNPIRVPSEVWYQELNQVLDERDQMESTIGLINGPVNETMMRLRYRY